MPCETGEAVQRIALAVICAAAVTLGPLAAEAQQAIRLSPGESYALTFVENPSTGYIWAIDPASSRGLDFVAMTDRGHHRGGTMPGARGERLWIVRALTPGHAEIAFVYRRAWEPAPVDSRRVVVDVAR
jgi:inhibitor of cysteine peptidase